MNWNTRENLKEIRLWITKVIVPVGAIIYVTNKDKVNMVLKDIKEKFNNH